MSSIIENIKVSYYKEFENLKPNNIFRSQEACLVGGWVLPPSFFLNSNVCSY